MKSQFPDLLPGPDLQADGGHAAFPRANRDPQYNLPRSAGAARARLVPPRRAKLRFFRFLRQSPASTIDAMK